MSETRPYPDDGPWAGRAILHVDMDAFFASVEQLDHPEWRGRPVIVGGEPGRRGVVAAASYEARAFGVRSAMPAAQAARLCPEAVWTRGHFDRYAEMSRLFVTELERHTPHVQQVSVDEAYLDVTPAAHGDDPVAVAREIQAAVDAMGLSCSVGVATSRTTAKIASETDKPHGLTVVRPGEEASFLAPLPVAALPGIGPVAASRLTSLGVRTLGDLAALDAETAARVLGTSGPDVVMRAAGIDERAVRLATAARSVSAERTFPTDVHERDPLLAALQGLVARVATRARAKELAGRTVTLKIRFSDFTTRTMRRSFERPTDIDHEVLTAAVSLLDEAWHAGVGVRLLGVGLSGFEAPPPQLDLFEQDAGDDRRRAVTRSVDAVREKYGDDAVRFGPGAPKRDDKDAYGPS